MRNSLKIFSSLLCIGLVAATLFEKKAYTHSPVVYSSPKSASIESFAPRTLTVTDGNVPAVHAASAVELSNGDIRAYWFGGSREGAADVSIWSAKWSLQSNIWSEPSIVLDRKTLEQQTGLNIRKLGNPVVHKTADGKLELYVVGVSMGGWAGSAIYHLDLDDEGLTYTSPKRLNKTPFMNISILAKAPILNTANGGVYLPLYHEFINKFPVFLHLNKEREVISAQSLQTSKTFIQPWVIQHEENILEGFLRRTRHTKEHYVYRIQSTDGGRSWTRPEQLDIPNPNSAVAALRTHEGTFLVCNDHPEDREILSIYLRKGLMTSADAEWKPMHVVDGPEREIDEQDENGRLRYSYPWIMQHSNGTCHLFYTWNRREIRHFTFHPSSFANSQP